MQQLRKLLSGYPMPALGLGLALGLALAWLWSLLHYTPDGSRKMSRARVRQTTTAIATHRAAIAADTLVANAAHTAAHHLLDTARRHAQRAVYFHQQAITPPLKRHAPKTPLPPAGPATAEELQRQLADQLR